MFGDGLSENAGAKGRVDRLVAEAEAIRIARQARTSFFADLRKGLFSSRRKDRQDAQQGIVSEPDQ